MEDTKTFKGVEEPAENESATETETVTFAVEEKEQDDVKTPIIEAEVKAETDAEEKTEAVTEEAKIEDVAPVMPPKKKKRRALRGDDIWTISTVVDGMDYTFSFTTLDLIYGDAQYGTVVWIGIDAQGRFAISRKKLSAMYASVFFDQDAGLVLREYFSEKKYVQREITDGMVITMDGYELTFTMEEKEYSGFIFSSTNAADDRNDAADETEQEKELDLGGMFKRALRATLGFFLGFKDSEKRKEKKRRFKNWIDKNL